ncbi:F-box/LRR-repeat protein 13-like [Raphanus sativus]|uniref:F-box/LRR-repeat protein 13-like n=1 Tax=Raphanus sativus TaxID=3726 RepID=A0A6J0L6B7_RAPSA|nr:F-box/LRR-repeat protein 13-like [Raphanus sativus]
MDQNDEKRHRFKRSRSEVDWISSLPDCLLSQILSNLPTNDVVKTSTLSTRWRNLWKQVPSLDLTIIDFPDHTTTFVPFLDTFLDLNNSCLHKFKLKYDCDGEIDHLSRWINTLVKRKVKHIDVIDDSFASWDFPIPTTLYTCESLVSLKLSGMTLPNPDLVSLPSLKTIYLTIAKFADELALERLISRCPVLESLGIERSFCDDVVVLRVRSRSLLRFSHFSDCSDDLDEELVVEIDAPRLEYLQVGDHRVASFVLKNVASLVEADIDTVFSFNYDKSFDPNDAEKRSVIRGFLVGISRVKDLTIASSTLEVIYDYSRCEPLPLFRNLTFLRVEFYGYRWEMLPVFLESCPNLKSLVVGSIRGREKEGVNILFQPQRLLSSLEYVKIERPLKGEAREMKLVSYLLGNSRILKKLTLFLDVSIKAEESVVLLKELLTIPRLSTSCQVVVP